MPAIVDPTPLIEARYRAELEQLRREMGEPRTWRERMRLRQAERELRRRLWRLRDVACW